MIDLALGVVASQLNQGLQRAFGVREDMAVLGHIVEQDGQVGTQVDNKLVVSLVNIERDAAALRPTSRGTGGPMRAAVMPAAVPLTLSVLFAANFGGGNYGEALKLISGTIGFFQSRPVLNHQNTPELDPRIDRLALDIANLDITELSNLWGILSGRYLPSVLYRVRMVTVDLGQISGQTHAVTEPRASVMP